MRLCTLWVFVLCLIMPATAATTANELLSSQEAAQLLKRMARAPQDNSYEGVYIHQFIDHMQTIHVVHVVREGNFEAERRESLDGPIREYLRQGQQVSMFASDGGQLLVDRHHTNKLFPRQLPDPPEQLLSGYQIRSVGRERVAGLDAEIYDFEPKDKLRYLHRFWLHPETGLTLKAAMFGQRYELIDLQVFSQVQVGGKINRKLLKPVHPLKPIPIETNNAPGIFTNRQLDIRPVPQGFQLLRQRLMPGRDKSVTHQLYGDGLVTVSVFIEPFDNKAVLGSSRQGAVNVFARRTGPYLVTALGEVPPETTQVFAALYQWKMR